METGRIIKGVGGFYYVQLAEGETVTCRARGHFRREGATPLVGDYVEVQPQNSGDWALQSILPRKNALVRPAVSNVDQLVIVAAASAPAPDWLLVDKLLLTAAQLCVAPLLVLNKLDESDSETLKTFLTDYAAFPSRCVSTVTHEGIDALCTALAGKTSCLAGQSAVGKSSLINALLPDSHQEVGALSQKTERGRHTTRHAELIPFLGGMLVDSPGFSLMSAQAVTQEQLDACYPEFAEAPERCRFAGCSHIAEPDCAVKERLAQGQIPQGRYQRYIALYQEIEQRRREIYD